VLHKTVCPADDEYKLWLEFLQLRASPELLDRLGDFLSDYLQFSGLNTYVLGLSGGLDSSFLAALLSSRNIPFLGFCLPMEGTPRDELDRARLVAKAYAPPLPATEIGHVHDLSDLYHCFLHTFEGLFSSASRVAQGNIKARIRMIFLYHVAYMYKGCVLGTDQLDELLTGFWTLHGDVGDVSPLQFIPKTVEYDLARLLCQRLPDPSPLMATITALPTDGLGISASDFEQLGVGSYALLEEMFRQYFSLQLKKRSQILSSEEHQMLEGLKTERPIALFLQSGFKRTGPILFDPRRITGQAL